MVYHEVFFGEIRFKILLCKVFSGFFSLLWLTETLSVVVNRFTMVNVLVNCFLTAVRGYSYVLYDIHTNIIKF